MAPRQTNGNIPKVGRHHSVLNDATRLPSFPRRSLRLQLRQEHAVSGDSNTKPNHPLLSTNSNRTEAEKREQSPNRKLLQEDPSNLAPSEPLQKQLRKPPLDAACKEICPQGTLSNTKNNENNPIGYWSKTGHWPKGYFSQDHQTRKELTKFANTAWLREKGLIHLLGVPLKSSDFRSEVGSDMPTTITPTDQKLGSKSIAYARPGYEVLLASNGSFMNEFNLGITDASKELTRTLLEAEQHIPQDTLFRDDLFDETCKSVRTRNEAFVFRYLSPLLCPSAQVLRIHGAKHLEPLSESVNEGWDCAQPLMEGSRPQPDYSVGFRRSAFTDDQLERLKSCIGEIPEICKSYFMATHQIYFAFLTCEVKGSAGRLEISERQNAYSMTVAVRGIVELFRFVNREKELHQEILAFSISHNHHMVKIHGHYPVINGKRTTVYCHPIHEFAFTASNGREKWTSYRFTKNVYDLWAPAHLKRICSIIDDLPLDSGALQQSEAGGSQALQAFESHCLADQMSLDAASLDEADIQRSSSGPRDVTLDTSLSQRIGEKAFKKPKKGARPVELHMS